jgi:hypothetical protein
MKSDADFKIEVVDVKDCEDGGAIFTLELDQRAIHLLVQAGFIALLTEALEKENNGDS